MRRCIGLDGHREFAEVAIWEQGEPLPAESVSVLESLYAELSGPLGERLRELITEDETEAVRARTGRLLRTGVHPAPSGEWPSIPWPPV